MRGVGHYLGVLEMSYVFSRGLRLVVPYLDTCRVRVKAAWVGREIQQVRHIYITLRLFFCMQPSRRQPVVFFVAFARIRCIVMHGPVYILWQPFTSHFILWPLIIRR